MVRNLSELYGWMCEQNPEVPVFDGRIADGRYPIALAAFVTSSSWDEWKKHAVYALHGKIYLKRLQSAKPTMRPETYRDHFAGASMHRANGYAHMASAAVFARSSRSSRAAESCSASAAAWASAVQPSKVLRQVMQAGVGLRCTL